MATRSSSGGPRQVGSYLGKITRPALGKRGLSEAEVVLRWPEIVGPQLARQCLPEKLSYRRGATGGGILQVRVEPAAATVVQHLEPQILERVNTYYGYRAVARLQLRQQPLPKAATARRQPPRRLTDRERAALRRAVAGGGDSPLRLALLALGESVLGRKSD